MSALPLASETGCAPALPPVRAFGRLPSDLDFAFEATDRPALVTAILAGCCAENGAAAAAREEAAWNLPVGARIARLLRIVALTTEGDEISAVATCPRADCRGGFEIALPFARLCPDADANPPAGNVVPFALPGSEEMWTLRFPTGRDQVRWRNGRYATTAEAQDAIMRSLLVRHETPVPPRQEKRGERDRAATGAGPSVPERLSPADLASLAAAMDAADPLVAFAVRTKCPHCDREVEVGVDLEAVALAELARSRRTLLRQVHALATRYGWSEAEVLAVPGVRRREYLRLIDAEDAPLP